MKLSSLKRRKTYYIKREFSLSFLNTYTLKWTLTLYAWLLRLNNALIIIPLVWPNYDAAAAQFSSSKIKQKNIHSNVGWWWRRRRWKFYLTLFESFNYDFSCLNNSELHIFYWDWFSHKYDKILTYSNKVDLKTKKHPILYMHHCLTFLKKC